MDVLDLFDLNHYCEVALHGKSMIKMCKDSEQGIRAIDLGEFIMLSRKDFDDIADIVKSSLAFANKVKP